MIGSSLCPERLRTVLGRLLFALGCADGPTSLLSALGDVSRLFVQAPPCADSGATAAESFGFVFAGAPSGLRAGLRAGPKEPYPVFCLLDNTARSLLYEKLDAYNMVAALYRAKGVPTAAQSPPPTAPARVPATAQAPAKWPVPLLTPLGLTTPATLSLIGTGANASKDDDGDTFEIKETTYITTKAIEKFPALKDRCLCVTASWQRPGGCETLYQHWNAQTRVGGETHAVISEDPHAPAEGLPSGEGGGALGFCPLSGLASKMDSQLDRH